MTSNAMPLRAIRVSDELWTKAQEKATKEGTTASEAIRKLLTEWVNQP